MSEDTPIDLPVGLRWVKLVCRLGRLVTDSVYDADPYPDLLPVRGTLTLTTSPNRLRIQEADGRWRSVEAVGREYNIRADGELVDDQGRVGVWMPDPASLLVEPQGYAVTAAVKPTGGTGWSVTIGGSTVLPDVVDLVAVSSVGPVSPTVTASFDARIYSLEQGGGVDVSQAVEDYLTANPPTGGAMPAGMVPIFQTLAEAQAWETANPGSVALHLESSQDPDPDPDDTTAPTGGTLDVTGTGDSRTLTVTGGPTDISGLHAQPFSFSVDDGTTWTAWQTPATWTTPTLAAGDYQPRARVRDIYGNAATLTAADFTVVSAPSDIYIMDFAAQPLGALTGWTAQWDTGSTRTVVEEASSLDGKMVSIVSSNNKRKAYYWDQVPVSTDVDVLARHRAASDTGNALHIYAFISGGVAAETGIGAQRYSASQARIGGYINGTLALPAQNDVADPITLSAWMWSRLRVEAGTIYVKQWWDGVPEPTSWTLTTAVPAELTDGRVGFGFSNFNYDLDYFAVALNGQTAPGPS